MPAITRARVILAATAVLVAYFGAMAASNAIEGLQLDRERAALEREIASYQQQHRDLTGLRAYLQSDEYVETVARRELGLVMPGEPAIVVVSPDGGAPAAIGAERTRWWQVLLSP